ncbi:unnamed protein product [Parnassius apollo]|uniref:(apollo) hypothetical protein n=1 Tax=Parnassius apollo TaxID=110799 RepID=A0A8S3WXP3_PARAO|nr:unnamed protein product [Parnassius apollo]
MLHTEFEVDVNYFHSNSIHSKKDHVNKISNTNLIQPCCSGSSLPLLAEIKIKKTVTPVTSEQRKLFLLVKSAREK